MPVRRIHSLWRLNESRDRVEYVCLVGFHDASVHHHLVNNQVRLLNVKHNLHVSVALLLRLVRTIVEEKQEYAKAQTNKLGMVKLKTQNAYNVLEVAIQRLNDVVYKL